MNAAAEDLWRALVASVRDCSTRLPPETFRELVLRGVEAGLIGHRQLMQLIAPTLQALEADAAAATRIGFVFDGSTPPDDGAVQIGEDSCNRG